MEQRVSKTFSLDSETVERLNRLSERTKIPMSRLIDLAVEDFYRIHSDSDDS